MTMHVERAHRSDRGAILPIVLIVVVVMGLVIVALADYASTTLRYGQVVERSGDRLAAANAAIDNTLEAIERQASLCALTPMTNDPGGYTFELGTQINGIEPSITCRSTGSDVTGIEEFALVLTSPGDNNGAGLINDALLNYLTHGNPNSPRKIIDGPVFMARPPNGGSLDTLNIQEDLTIRRGDLWYSADTACPDSAAVLPTRVSIASIGYDVRCLDHDWNTLFGAAKPPEPSIGSFALAPPPDTTGACHIWEPGRYTSKPVLAPGSHNYFKSGDYYLDLPGTPSTQTGRWEIGDAWVLVGAPGPGGPSLRTADGSPQQGSNPCESAWLADTTVPAGATIYLGGSSRIDVLASGAFEVSGREQAGRRVAVQAFETQNASTLTDDTPRLLKASDATSSQFVVHGLVWAPANSIELGRLSNPGTAALNGGAVLGELHLGAADDATNYLVRAGSTPAPRTIEITATATSPEGGTTEVKAVIRYRDGDYALLSRRVQCVTPETSGC